MPTNNTSFQKILDLLLKKSSSSSTSEGCITRSQSGWMVRIPDLKPGGPEVVGTWVLFCLTPHQRQTYQGHKTPPVQRSALGIIRAHKPTHKPHCYNKAQHKGKQPGGPGQHKGKQQHQGLVKQVNNNNNNNNNNNKQQHFYYSNRYLHTYTCLQLAKAIRGRQVCRYLKIHRLKKLQRYIVIGNK